MESELYPSRTRGPTTALGHREELATRRQRRARHRRMRKRGEAMSIRVIVEVLDHWSDLGLTRGERDDLLVIAENVNDITRETYRGIHHEYILKRAGKQAAAWKNAIGALMKKGVLEYAVHRGVPQTAHRGRVAVYRIPVLCPEPPHDGLFGQCTRSEKVIREMTQSTGLGHLPGDPTGEKRVTSPMTQAPEMGHGSDDPMDGMGHPADAEWVIPQMTPTPQSPQKTSPLSVPLASIRRFVGLTEEEERELENWIAKTHKPHGPGWWRKLADNGDLAVIIEAWKVGRTPMPPRNPAPYATRDCADCRTPTRVLGPDGRCDACRAKGAAPAASPRHATADEAYEWAVGELAHLPNDERNRWKSMARAELPEFQRTNERAVTVRAAKLHDASKRQPPFGDPRGAA